MTTIHLNHTGIKRFASTHDEQIKDIITEALQGANLEIQVYSIGTTNIHAFDRDSNFLHMFNHSTYRGDKKGDQFTIDGSNIVTLWGKAFPVERMFLPYEGGVLIQDDDGNVAGQYFPDKRTLNVFIDLLSDPSNDSIFVLGKIFEQVYVVMQDEITENSFKLSKRREALIERTRAMLEGNFENSIRHEKNNVERYTRETTEYQGMLHTAYLNMQQAMKTYDALSSDKEGAIAKKLEQFMLAADYEKVADLEVVDDKIIVTTQHINIYNPKTGAYHVGGKYRIEIKMLTSDVRFFAAQGTKTHRGYWTSHDPHPHVNGSDGKACLGNVASTIAELCSQSEFYALVLVAISFLEMANPDDGAGAKISNWPVVK